MIFPNFFSFLFNISQLIGLLFGGGGTGGAGGSVDYDSEITSKVTAFGEGSVINSAIPRSIAQIIMDVFLFAVLAILLSYALPPFSGFWHSPNGHDIFIMWVLPCLFLGIPFLLIRLVCIIWNYINYSKTREFLTTILGEGQPVQTTASLLQSSWRDSQSRKF